MKRSKFTPLPSASELKMMHPTPEAIVEQVTAARLEISDIIHGRDDRLLLVVGPCSIHDSKSAIEYAKRLKQLADKHKDSLCIVMRTYFEKSRTSIGWKGFLYDPHLDGSNNFNLGLQEARSLLIQINQLGVRTGCEFLDINTANYFNDLVSWATIGARTSESPVHRALASGLAMPIGIKNGTSGNIDISINGVLSAKHSHQYIASNEHGRCGLISTSGNNDCHVILRGGASGPNYNHSIIQNTSIKLHKHNLTPKLMIDCSHDNSGKNHEKQLEVAMDIIDQIHNHDAPIFGVMLESFLNPGRQDFFEKNAIQFGKSITDPCLGWEQTKNIINEFAKAKALNLFKDVT